MEKSPCQNLQTDGARDRGGGVTLVCRLSVVVIYHLKKSLPENGLFVISSRLGKDSGQRWRTLHNFGLLRTASFHLPLSTFPATRLIMLIQHAIKHHLESHIVGKQEPRAFWEMSLDHTTVVYWHLHHVHNGRPRDRHHVTLARGAEPWVWWEPNRMQHVNVYVPCF